MPSHLTAWEGKVFFQADDCTTGPEMWVTDGTTAGTVLVADVRPGSPGGFPSFFTPLNSPSTSGGERLFFLANGGGYDAAYPSGVAQGWGGAQLWLSDGTRDGTRRAFEQRTAGDISPDRESLLAGRPARMAVFDGALYLPATQDPLVAVEHMMGINDTTREGISQVRAFKNWIRADHSLFCCKYTFRPNAFNSLCWLLLFTAPVCDEICWCSTPPFRCISTLPTCPAAIATRLTAVKLNFHFGALCL